MRTTVRKWGNSLALHIPRAMAQDLSLAAGTHIELSLKNGKMVVEPVRPPAWTLKDLLAGVTPENLHREVESGPARGKEAW